MSEKIVLRRHAWPQYCKFNISAKQDLLSSTAEYVLSSHRYSGLLYTDSYSFNMLKHNKVHTDLGKNLPFS